MTSYNEVNNQLVPSGNETGATRSTLMTEQELRLKIAHELAYWYQVAKSENNQDTETKRLARWLVRADQILALIYVKPSELDPIESELEWRKSATEGKEGNAGQ